MKIKWQLAAQQNRKSKDNSLQENCNYTGNFTYRGHILQVSS